MGDSIVRALHRHPYFQPPGANLEAPINLTKVDGVALAPQDRLAGKLAIGQVVLVK